MIIYITFLILIFTLMLLDTIGISKENKINEYNKLEHSDTNKAKLGPMLSLTLLTTVAFASFRFDVGWDYPAYYNTIKHSVVTNIVSNGEYITIFLIELSRDLNIINLYFFLNSLISITLIFHTIKNYSKDKWLSIIFFITFPLFFLNSFSVIRLFSALAITFYGFKFIVKGQFFRYLIIVIIASMFHASASIALLFFFIRNLKLSTLKIIIIMLSLPFIGSLINNLVVNYFPKYSIYTQVSNGQEGTKAIFVFIFIGIVSIIMRKKIIDSDKNANIYFNIYFLGLSIYLMFLSQGTMGHRLSLFGTIYSLLLVPTIISLFNKEKDRVLIKFIIFVCCLIFFLYTLHVGRETYIPYKTIFH